jgi:uncharacterized membrane protein YbhN (UPF0104 family)
MSPLIQQEAEATGSLQLPGATDVKAAGGTRRWLQIVRALGSVLLIASVAFFALRRNEWPAAGQWRWLLTPANLLPGAVLAGFVIVSVLLRGLRWSVLVSTGNAIERWRLVAGFGWCFLVLQAIPFRGGEPYRILWIKLRGGSAAQAAAGAILDRLIDAVVMCSILGIAVISQPEFSKLVGMRTAAILLCGGLIALAATIFAAPAVLRSLIRRLRSNRFTNILEHALAGLTATMPDSWYLSVILLTVASWGGMACAFSIYLSSTLGTGWPLALGVLAAVNLSGILTIAPGNVGIFEAVTVAILVAAHVAPDAALIAAIGLHVGIILGQSLTGIACEMVLFIYESRHPAGARSINDPGRQ